MKKIILPILFFFVSSILLAHKALSIEKEIVIVVPSYNNKMWYEKNLDSIFSQNYENFHVIYINDSSIDGTYDLVKKYIKKNNKEHKITLINNKSRQGALSNIYKAIYLCNDDVVIAILDGDDWFAHNDVLSYINDIYTSNDVWLTYGQYKRYPSGALGHATAITENITKGRTLRKIFPFPFTHLRTFYAWLFKKIKQEDLMDQNGKFFSTAWDVAIMFPMVEMAKDHFMFIPNVLYVYNTANPINDHKISRKKQHETSVYIRENKPKYEALDSIDKAFIQ